MYICLCTCKLFSCQHEHSTSDCSGQDGTGANPGSGDGIFRHHIKAGLCCAEVKGLVYVHVCVCVCTCVCV